MQNITDWITNLQQTKDLILVEGKKDKLALEKLDIKNIITLDKPLYEIVESITRKTIILTDLDAHGKKLYAYFKNNLQKRGIKVDPKFREFLFTNTKLTQIEGLTKYLEKFD